MFFTTNRTTTVASNIDPSEIITSIELAAFAGQASEPFAFRIGSDDEYGSTLNLTCPDPNIELSLNAIRGYGSSVTLSVPGGGVGDSIYVRAVAGLDATEGDAQAVIFGDDGSSLPVSYFFASTDEAHTDSGPAIRFTGPETVDASRNFEKFGEAVRLVRYEPLPGPPRPTGAFPLQDIRNRSPEERCNPRNSVVGYTQEEFFTRVFVGARNLDINSVYVRELALAVSDVGRILISPEFIGFDPDYLRSEVFFSFLMPQQFQASFQRTQWTVSGMMANTRFPISDSRNTTTDNFCSIVQS